MAPGLPFAHLNLRFNPFGEPAPEERDGLAIVDLPEFGPGEVVQFLGESGHGKTTHLLALRARDPRAVYEKLEEGEDRWRSCPSGPAPFLLDEAQRIRRSWRRRLFAEARTLALGTHEDLSAYSDRPVRTVRLVGLTTPPRLRDIVDRRIEWARRGPGPVPVVPDPTLRVLMERHGGDVRAIFGLLYDSLQKQKEPGHVQV